MFYKTLYLPLFVGWYEFKNMERFTNLRVILRRGHANLLCIVLILVYVLSKRALLLLFERKYLNTQIGDRFSEHYKGAVTKALPFLMIVSVTLSSYVLFVINEVHLYKPFYGL